MNDPVAAMVRETLGDASWLAHRYDPASDSVHFVAAPREDRRQVPFLTNENLPAAASPRVLRRLDVSQAPAGSVHFIFHSAYCCSTLLAACFDLPGRALALKEPQFLNDMVGWRQRGGPPQQIAQVMDQGLALLARPFVPGEAAVIKPSNIVNGLAQVLLAIRPGSRAILLHAPVRVFLTSIARKGLWGRLWVRELFAAQLADGLVADMGFDDSQWLRQSDLQIAAVGWLAQQRLFHRMLERWPDRLRSLDSEMLVARPAEAMQAAANLYGLALSETTIAASIAENFARDTKTGDAFAAGQREADRKAGEAAHADEIDKVTVWIEAVAQANGLALNLPNPLI